MTFNLIDRWFTGYWRNSGVVCWFSFIIQGSIQTKCRNKVSFLYSVNWKWVLVLTRHVRDQDFLVSVKNIRDYPVRSSSDLKQCDGFGAGHPCWSTIPMLVQREGFLFFVAFKSNFCSLSFRASLVLIYENIKDSTVKLIDLLNIRRLNKTLSFRLEI
jgi:hypothetical protein